jgi:hypothetical protein
MMVRDLGGEPVCGRIAQVLEAMMTAAQPYAADDDEPLAGRR